MSKRVEEERAAQEPVTVIDGFIKQEPSSIPTSDEHNALLVEQIEELREAVDEQNKQVIKTTRDLKKLQNDGFALATNIYIVIKWFDEEMKKPSDNERGKRIAKALNELEMCTDRFAHFTLKQSFEEIKKMKNKKVKS